MNKSKKVKGKSKNYEKILLIRLDRIGDVVLSTPAIKAVRDAYPDSFISFMVRPYARDIIEGNPYLDEVMIYDKPKGLVENIKFIKMLRQRRFDLAIALHPTTRTHLIIAFVGIPERIGYDRKWGWLLTKKMQHTKQLGAKHETEYALDLLRYIGIEVSDKTLYMPITDKSEHRVNDIFSRYNIKDKDVVVTINPSASCPSKQWSRERFARVCDELVRRYGARIIMISNAVDAKLANSVASMMKAEKINLSGVTTVSDIASILKRSTLFISNDSGPVHIACAVGTPVVAIFGRSDKGLSPKRWGPSGKRDIVLHKDVGCEVCLAHKCKRGFKCLEAITVDEVLAAAAKILGKDL